MRKKTRKGEAKPQASKDETREALEFCFEDVSSLRMLGSAPLSDLTSGPGPAAASGASREAHRDGGQRWNLVVLALLVLTLAVTTAATLLGR